MQYNPTTLHYVNLPVGQSKKETGFWSTKKECIINLINEINNTLSEITGGGYMWGDEVIILQTELNNVETDSIEKYKSGHTPKFDDGEIFVKEIIDLTKINRKSWEDFLNEK